MKYSLRQAIRFIAKSGDIELTDEEVTSLILECGEDIERMGRTVREAAQKYEEHVIQLAAEIVNRRPAPIPAPKGAADVRQHN